jgi:hypothetical protein
MRKPRPPKDAAPGGANTPRYVRRWTSYRQLDLKP